MTDPADWTKRSRPVVTLDTEFWWEGLKKNELRIQRCGECGALQHPPEPFCAACGGDRQEWIVAKGAGEVYSFVVYHEPKIPGFDYPYVVAVVELDEGTRVVANVEGIEPAKLAIGMKVQVEFRRVDDELTLPFFRPL